MSTKRKANELYLSRVYDAPVRLVWAAWTDPQQVSQWWGPRGFTLTTKSKDLRPGGKWIYTMHGPDGVDYPNIATYHEVIEGKRLVYDHGATETTPPLFRVTVTFEEQAGKTHMDMTMTLETPEAAAEIKKFIKQAGGNSTWDRLAEYLEKENSSRDVFVINRSFAGSVELIYDMWTKPEHVSRWLPPTGFAMEFLNKDLKVGGRSLFKLFNSEGLAMYGSITYKEMTKPGRIVYEQDFRDAEDRISRHPMLPTWPPSMIATVTLAPEADNETRVTVEWQPSPQSTAEEVAVFVSQKPGMTVGWTGSFDKLDEILRQPAGGRL